MRKTEKFKSVVYIEEAIESIFTIETNLYSVQYLHSLASELYDSKEF